jgi:nicotinamide-nucleotide amidase
LHCKLGTFLGEIVRSIAQINVVALHLFRRHTGATLGLGVTGIAGPTGGTEAKPVGLVHIALCDAQKTESVERTFRGDRTRVREWATQQALDLIRRRLR